MKIYKIAKWDRSISELEEYGYPTETKEYGHPVINIEKRKNNPNNLDDIDDIDNIEDINNINLISPNNTDFSINLQEANELLNQEIQKLPLPEINKTIFKMYFGLNKDNNNELSLTDIAKKFNINKEKIRQIIAKTLRLLRESKNYHKLHELHKLL